MEKYKKQSLLFRVFDGMAQAVYSLREDKLQRLNDRLDREASKHYKE